MLHLEGMEIELVLAPKGVDQDLRGVADRGTGFRRMMIAQHRETRQPFHFVDVGAHQEKEVAEDARWTFPAASVSAVELEVA